MNSQKLVSETYFQAGKELADVMNCSDLKTLQALMCMILYLQALGMVPTCYSYISLAMAACTRMGLHRSDSQTKFNTVDREHRKRIFWALRSMESYITTILDLPRTLSEEDTDQDFPCVMEDQNSRGGKPQRRACSPVSAMALANAHTKLLIIMGNFKRFILGSCKSDSRQGGTYRVDYARIVEAEKELESWNLELPQFSGMQEPDIAKLDM
jgi:hypothetical protein